MEIAGGFIARAFFDDLQSVGGGLVEVQVGDDELGLMGGEAVDRPVQVGERKNLMPISAEQVGDHLDHGQLVID
jgi:hypothetical protein